MVVFYNIKQASLFMCQTRHYTQPLSYFKVEVKLKFIFS